MYFTTPTSWDVSRHKISILEKTYKNTLCDFSNHFKFVLLACFKNLWQSHLFVWFPFTCIM